MMHKAVLVILNPKDKKAPFLLNCRNCHKLIPMNHDSVSYNYPSCSCSSNCNADAWYLEITCPHCKITFIWYQGKWFRNRHEYEKAWRKEG